MQSESKANSHVETVIILVIQGGGEFNLWVEYGLADKRIKDLFILGLLRVCSHVELNMCMLILNNLKFWWLGKHIIIFISLSSFSAVKNPKSLSLTG